MDGIGQRLSTQGLTVDDKGMLGGLFEMRHPVEQRWLVGMCGQATDGVDFRAYRDAFAKQGDLTRTIDQSPPQRSRSLEADNQDGAFTAPQVVAQMVAYCLNLVKFSICSYFKVE